MYEQQVPIQLSAKHIEGIREVPVVYDQPWHQGRIEALAQELHSPLNFELTLAALLRLVTKLEPTMDQYGLMLAEGESSRWSAGVVAQMINHRRRILNKPPVRLLMIDDDKPYMPKHYFDRLLLSAANNDRALLLTEYIITGANVKHAYKEASRYLPASAIDVAAVGINLEIAQHNAALQGAGTIEGWFDAGTSLFYNDETWGIERSLSKTPIRHAFDPATLPGDTQKVVQGLESILFDTNVSKLLPQVLSYMGAATASYLLSHR